MFLQISPMEVKCTVNWEQYLTQDIVDDMVSVAYPLYNTLGMHSGWNSHYLSACSRSVCSSSISIGISSWLYMFIWSVVIVAFRWFVRAQDSLASHYKTRPECPNFAAQWKDDITFLKKLKVQKHHVFHSLSVCLSVCLSDSPLFLRLSLPPLPLSPSPFDPSSSLPPFLPLGITLSSSAQVPTREFRWNIHVLHWTACTVAILLTQSAMYKVPTSSILSSIHDFDCCWLYCCIAVIISATQGINFLIVIHIVYTWNDNHFNRIIVSCMFSISPNSTSKFRMVMLTYYTWVICTVTMTPFCKVYSTNVFIHVRVLILWFPW